MNPQTTSTPVGPGTAPEAAILAALALRAPGVRAADPHRLAYSPLAAWMTALLDQIACGLVLVDAQARVRYLNLAALRQLDGLHPLVLGGQHLKARDPDNQAPLKAALVAASQGQRRLVSLGDPRRTAEVSVVPLRGAGENGLDGPGGQASILLVLGAPRTAQPAAAQALARCVGLTPAETRVLDQLCAGVRPAEIASRLGVAISTVRTQIGSARRKTGAASIRALVRQVAVMPPLH